MAGWNDSSRAGWRLSFLNRRTLNVSTSVYFPMFCHIFLHFTKATHNLAARSLGGTASDYAFNQQFFDHFPLSKIKRKKKKQRVCRENRK